jgi:hypothetical protein
VTAVQSFLGDRDTPASSTPDTIPAGCYWWTDPDGDLCLLPGCAARVQDPDAECTCDTLAARLETARRQLRDMKEQQRQAGVWWDALREAVEGHPDRAAILAEAHRKAGR